MAEEDAEVEGAVAAAAEASLETDDSPGRHLMELLPIVRDVIIVKDEESLRARRTLSRGTAVLPQVEYMHLIHLGGLNLPERQCQYGGSNRGTIIGPVKTPAVENEWKLTMKDIS